MKVWTQEMRDKCRVANLGKKLTPEQRLVALSNLRPGYWLGKKRLGMIGDKNPSWKGGTTDINKRLRKTFEYEEWRKKIFERDDYTCQLCGEVGGRLHADHIKPFALYPELRLEASNGRTLCEDCHKQTPTYLNRWYRRIG